MHDTYFVEERSGVIGIGPLTNSPDLYYRRTKTDWGSLKSWLHLLIILLAVPLIIWNLYLLMETLTDYTQQTVLNPRDGSVLYTRAHWFGTLIIVCAILMNLLGGVFALVTEAANFSDKLAKFLYIMVYLSITISVYAVLVTHNIIGPLWLIVLGLFMICWGVGFWRFTIISSIYLNEEGPVWFKPLLYGCLAAIPILTTSSQCRNVDKNIYGCLPNHLFGGRYMYNDVPSFVIMTTIAILSALPYLFGTTHN